MALLRGLPLFQGKGNNCFGAPGLVAVTCLEMFVTWIEATQLTKTTSSIFL